MIANTETTLPRARLSAEKQALLQKRLRGTRVGADSPTIPRHVCNSSIPLSFAQHRIWFFHQLEPSSPLYNLAAAFRIRGALDRTALTCAINAIVARHEALRTRFASTDGCPKQVIVAHSPLEIPILNLLKEPAARREDALQKLLNEEATRAFDLRHDTPIRVVLVQLGDTEHALLVNLHHIVSDAWSLGVFFRELATLYEAFDAGRDASLTELPIQYPDYATWQREWIQGDVLQRQLAYWKGQLAGAPHLLELPTDKPRLAVQSFRGGHLWQPLPRALADALKQFSQAEGSTLFMTLLSAFEVLLHRYTRQTDFLVGSPIAGRNRLETEGLIGFFVNTLALRADLSGDPPFRDLLARVRNVTLAACAHQDLPFEKLVEELQPARSSTHTPLVQVAFSLQAEPALDLKLPGLTVTPLSAETSTSKFDFTLLIEECADGLLAGAEYSTDLFTEATVQRMLGQFQLLLEGIVANPLCRIGELQLITNAERERTLVEWNSTARAYPRDQTVAQLFEEQVSRSPESMAVVCRGTRLNYRELNARANQLAHRLQREGIGPDVLVAVCLERSVKLIVALTAILKAGGAYVALDPTHPGERLAFMLQDARVPMLLTDEGHQTKLQLKLPGLKMICLDADGRDLAGESLANPRCSATAENLAYVSFTSGSTGQPKGVCIPQRAVARLLFNTDYITLGSSEVIAQVSNCAFDASTFEIWGALLHGGKLVLIPSEVVLSPPDFAREIRQNDITIMFVTTALFNQLTRDMPGIFQTVRHLLFGGEVVNSSCVREVLKAGPPGRLMHVYGPTETTTFATWHEVREVPADGATIPIGRPITNTELYVLDEHLKTVPVGVPGELYIGGDGLARGYLNRPELTVERFVPHPFSSDSKARLYRTGDLVRYRANGEIEFIGRADSQIKLRGFRVELGEIEANLVQHPAVRECVVAAREDGSGEKRLVAYIVAIQSPAPVADELQVWLRTKLPEYMVPSAFVFLDALPLNTNGKVDRRALPAPDHNRAGVQKEFVPPCDEIERQLAGIWEEVLDVRPVGLRDNFFELGGHSLLVVRLLARIEKSLGKTLPVSAVFQSATLEEFAKRVREEKADAPRAASSIIEIQPNGSKPPLFLVHGAGGGMFWGYTGLSRHLGSDQPVYAFKSRGSDGREEFSSIEEMAVHYTADLRAFQPCGPYYLGGYCFGGNVAYEMARLLQAAGERVALLALMNCVPPNGSYDHFRVTPSFCLKFVRNVAYWVKYFFQLRSERQREFLHWKLRAIKRGLLRPFRRRLPDSPDFEVEDFVDLSVQPDGRRSLWIAHIRALVNHAPKPYAGHVTLFRTWGHPLYCSFDGAFGWRELASGGVTVRIVPGAHESILDDPHVQALARELRECLHEAQRAAVPPSTPLRGTTDSPGATNALEPMPVERVAGGADDPRGKCVHQLIEEQVGRTPDAVAVVFRNERISYRELDARANMIAAQLLKFGVGPDVPVGVCLERSPDMVVAVLAVLKAGGAYVPLDTAYPKERLQLMISNSRSQLVLTQRKQEVHFKSGSTCFGLLLIDQLIEQVSNSTNRSRTRTMEQDSEGNPQSVIRTPKSTDLAYVIHTSGSTGVPKGVAIEHRNAVNFIRWAQQTFSQEELAGVLFSTSLCFDLSVFELFVTLSTGGKVIIARNAIELPDLPAKDEITLINTVPSAAAELLRLKAIPRSVQVINLAGEALKPSLVDQIYALGTVKKVHDLYGPSETTTYSTYALRQADAPATIGRPIANTQIHLLDESGQRVPTGEAGEIYIGGDGVARGYLHRPDLTAERFLPDLFSNNAQARLYRTGDVARWRSDGNLEFLGRIDDQIKIRGHRVEPGEVETTLAQHHSVRECVVVPREKAPGQKCLVAYVVCHGDRAAVAFELHRFLRARLPEHLVPSAIVPLAALPLSTNGKVDRKRLPAPDPSRPELAEEFVAPTTDEEEKLVSIWREVLDLEGIGIRDNFFELGGDSLLAVRVVARMRETFGVESPVSAVFDAPTITALAEGLKSARWSAGQSSSASIEMANRDGTLPLSSSQRRLWFLDQLEPGSCAYNVPAAVDLEGMLDAAALEDCLNEIVHRHEILRTTFPTENGNPVQAIAPSLALAIETIDLTNQPELDREPEAHRRIKAEAERAFDLARGPLVRCTLLRLGQEKHILVVVMHHIVSDGWSLGVFFQELADLYSAKTAKSVALLPELPIQYADYAVWERESLLAETLKSHSAFWGNTLAGAPSSLPLPTDHDGSVQSPPRADRCVVEVEKHLADSIQRLNRRLGHTLFMTLLAGLIIVLSRWTRQGDVVIGTVSAGRTRREVERLIGCFMNFIPIRTKVFESATGLELLAQIKQTVLEAHVHLDCPFEKIVEAVNPARLVSCNPIYNVGLLLQNFPRTMFSTRWLKGQWRSVEPGAALLDMRFIADEFESGLCLTCEYRTDRFKRETIEQLLLAFRAALRQLASEPECKIADFEFSPDLERQAAAARMRQEKDTIGIAATFTAEPLQEPLQFWMRELELPAEIKFAPYNQVFQQLLDPASVFARNQRGLNVVLARLEDWERSAAAEAEAPEQIEQAVQELVIALKSAAHRNTTPMLACLCPSAKALTRHPHRSEYFRQLERRVADEVARLAGIQCMTADEILALYPVAEPYDPQGDELGHVPYTPAFFAALATTISRKFHATRRLSPKVIVLDCDQTLWSGVCGEDGPSGIQLDPPRRALQEFMRRQLDAGRLLCLCSKNNEGDVRAVFEQRPEMPLRPEHFAATRINWKPKSENLKELAEELNLDLDSFVLVDDSPVECAEVEARCPQALVLLLPDPPESIPRFLQHCWLFDHSAATDEDQQRTLLYQQHRQREQLRTESRSIADFLAALDLKVEIGEMTSDQFPRVAQLTQRTNQFNCTTHRRTETQIQTMLADWGWKALAVSVGDRFGSYGLVGAVLCKTDAGSLVVETFLLSCRALGRGVEHRILAHLGRLAQSRSLQDVVVHFIPRARNQPALDFLESVGSDFKQAQNGGYVFRFPADVAAAAGLERQARANLLVPAETPHSDRFPSPHSDSLLKCNGEGDLASRSARPRYRWIALEANNSKRILDLIEARTGIRARIGTTCVEPRTQLERQMCDLWADLLHVEKVGIHDNFFELGGHSLLAVRLFSHVEKTTGKRLPVVTIFQSPTVEELCSALASGPATSAHSAFVPIQPRGSRPPLILVHGAGGDVLWGYANLARCLNPDQPVYGIQARDDEAAGTLEELASHYAADLRCFQARGPYFLGGYCFGGNVAHEMARQLQAQGETVALLALLDCAPSNGSYHRVHWWRPNFTFQFTRNLGFWLANFSHLEPAEKRSLVTRKIRSLARKAARLVQPGSSADEIDLDEVIDLARVSPRECKLWRLHLQFLARHVSKPYYGNVALLRTRGHPVLCSFEEDFGWAPLASCGVTVKWVPGSHERIFLEPNVKVLAGALEASLNDARSRSFNRSVGSQLQSA